MPISRGLIFVPDGSTKRSGRRAKHWKSIRNFSWLITISARCCNSKDTLSEAIAEFQKAVDLNGDPDSLGMLGQAYARNGQKDEAQKILLRLNEEAKSRYVAPYATALVYLGLGEKERALDELERAYQRGDTNYLFVIRVDPLLDDLRGHPRFDALVQKIVGGK